MAQPRRRVRRRHIPPPAGAVPGPVRRGPRRPAAAHRVRVPDPPRRRLRAAGRRDAVLGGARVRGRVRALLPRRRRVRGRLQRHRPGGEDPGGRRHRGHAGGAPHGDGGGRAGARRRGHRRAGQHRPPVN
ncbi:hypothetical protein SEVIR_7G318502v4 [Setaria viridis]